MIDLAIIIINYKTKELVLDLLKSIYDNKPTVKSEVWVMDNGSADDSVAIIKKKFPEVRIIESEKNLGFSGGNNLVLKKAKARNYLLLNSDTKILGLTLDNLCEFADNSEFGIISCKLLNADKSFQPNGGDLPTILPVLFWLSGFDDILSKIARVPSYQIRKEEYYTDEGQIGWVSGSVMLIKDEVLHKAGLLDEKIFMYGEDVEYCLRANRRGFKIGWTNQSEIIHLGGASSKNPKYNQWMGEFKGLFYIYNKFFGFGMALLLRVLFYFFILARIIAFTIFGKISYAQTYAKIIINL